VAQALKRFFEISQSAAGGVGQHAQRTDHAQAPSLRFLAGGPLVYQQEIGGNFLGQSDRLSLTVVQIHLGFERCVG